MTQLLNVLCLQTRWPSEFDPRIHLAEGKNRLHKLSFNIRSHVHMYPPKVNLMLYERQWCFSLGVSFAHLEYAVLFATIFFSKWLNPCGTATSQAYLIFLDTSSEMKQWVNLWWFSEPKNSSLCPGFICPLKEERMICCEEDKVHITLPTTILTVCFLHCCTSYGRDNELQEMLIPTASQHCLPCGRCGRGGRGHSCTKELVV